MQDSKDIKPTIGSEAEPERASKERDSRLHSGDSTDADGWQQYRKWISTAPAPRTRRGSLDPSLYTWKGYRSWTEQVKRNWSDS